VGLLYLWIRVSEESSLYAALTLTLYVFVYTPLKRVSSLNTLVGALPGAIPPLIGYAAARSHLDPRAWVLFGLIFIWQLPHFLAIAWLYRAEYRKAGMYMLPNDDPNGVATGLQMAVHALTLLPLSMLPLYFRMAGKLYLLSALALGLAFLGSCIVFLIYRNDKAARGVFLTSVCYLPLLFSVMMFDSLG
jgi:protoheme IX farnesyltransferase